jgi:hypothetical protein
MTQVNGIFDPTDEVFGGYIRYRKRGGQDCWMEYNELRKQWHIKPEASKTTTNAWAYAVYPTAMAPHLRRGVWHLYDGSLFDRQPDVIVMPELKPVVISGATGNVAPQVNGTFDPTDEICNGWVRYRKRGGRTVGWSTWSPRDSGTLSRRGVRTPLMHGRMPRVSQCSPLSMWGMCGDCTMGRSLTIIRELASQQRGERFSRRRVVVTGTVTGGGG